MCQVPTFADDLSIHSLELDAALKEFLYSIVLSERTQTVYIVLGSSDHRRLGQGMTDLFHRDSTHVGRVDGYWVDNVLGQSFAQGLQRRLQYQLPWKGAPKHIVLCGFGGGGAFATILGVLLSPDFPNLQVWTYGAPKVGDAVFQQAHVTLETKSQLRQVRFVNRGDPMPNQPIVSLDGWYRSVGVRVELPNSIHVEHPHSMQAYLRRIQHWKCSLPLNQWYEQETTSRAVRTKTIQRQILLATFFIIVYSPLVYLKWNKMGDSPERMLTTATTPSKVFDRTNQNSLDLEDPTTFDSPELLDMEEDTFVVSCLHCPGDPSEMIIWPTMDTNDEEPEAIQRAAIAEEKANEEIMAATENDDAQEVETVVAIVEAHSAAEEERILTPKAVEEKDIIHEDMNGAMSVDLKVHAVMLEVSLEPEPVLERATIIADQAVTSIEERTEEDESVLAEEASEYDDDDDDDAQEVIHTADVTTATSMNEGGLFQNVLLAMDLHDIEEKIVVDKGDEARNHVSHQEDESEMSPLEKMDLELVLGGEDSSPATVLDTEEEATTMTTIPIPDESPSSSMKVDDSLLAAMEATSLAMESSSSATIVRAVFQVMSFRPLSSRRWCSSTIQDMVVIRDLVQTRVERRHIHRIFSQWEQEWFHRTYLYDDDNMMTLDGWKRPEK